MRLLRLPEHLSTMPYYRVGCRARRGANRAMSDVRNRFCYRFGIWILGEHGTAGSHGKALVRPQVRLGDIDGDSCVPRYLKRLYANYQNIKFRHTAALALVG